MFSNCLVALVTPMHLDGCIDMAAFEQLVLKQISAGCGLVVLGTTGEAPTITQDERCQLIELAVAKAAGKVPVWVGTGSNNTKQAIELSLQAKALGCDGLLISTPYYNKPMQEGLYQHYKSIAEAVDMPIMLYNVPGRTACDLQPETVARLASIPSIVAIKEASGDLDRIPALVTTGLKVYSGNDNETMGFVRAGGVGVVSVAANILPEAMVALVTSLHAGYLLRAEQIDKALAPINQALFIESNPIPAKWLLASIMRHDNGIRLPLTPLSESSQTKVIDAYQQTLSYLKEIL